MLNKINSQDLENMGEKKLESCTWYYYHHDQESRSRNRCSEKESILPTNLYETLSGGKFTSSLRLSVPVGYSVKEMTCNFQEIHLVTAKVSLNINSWKGCDSFKDKPETLILIHRINNKKTLDWFPSETTLILSVTSSQNSPAFWHSHNTGDKVCPAHSHSQQAPCVSFKTLKWNSKPFTKRSYSGKLREHKY